MAAPKKKTNVPPAPRVAGPSQGQVGPSETEKPAVRPYVGPKINQGVPLTGSIVPAVPPRKKKAAARTSASRKRGASQTQNFDSGDDQNSEKLPFIERLPLDEPSNWSETLDQLASQASAEDQNPLKPRKRSFNPRYPGPRVAVESDPLLDALEAPDAETRASLRASDTPVSSRGEARPEAPEAFVSGRMAENTINRSNETQKRSSAFARDIAKDFDPSTINWERRLRCKKSLIDFAFTYYASIFTETMAADHYRVAEKLQDATDNGGLFAVAMPRGQGKTAWCRAAVARAVVYGLRRFVVYVGASEKKAVQSLDNIKTFLFTSRLLMEDFPEICHAVRALENRSARASGQLFNGRPTAIEWYDVQVRLPSFSLTLEQSKYYPDDELLTPNGLIVPKSAGVVIKAVGIESSIRGEAETHPVTLEQPRPDLTILDDIQKDQTALNPETVAKLSDVVDGTILGLAGPGKAMAAVMPCTVIQKGDLSDTYLDREKKPKWRGERCSLVTHWPEGIDNDAIGFDTEAGRYWNRYADVRRDSLQRFGDNRLGNEYYSENREVMDAGFEVSWPERYNKQAGPEQELSAQQAAMHFRMDTNTFLSEYQNIGRTPAGLREMPYTAEDIAKRVGHTPRGVVPYGTHALVGFIDVSNEILWYGVAAFQHNMTGVLVEYGTWPQIESLNFTKEHTGGWSRISKDFAKAHPNLVGNMSKTDGGKPRAPLDAKIYWAMDQCVKWLMGRNWPIENILADTIAQAAERLGAERAAHLMEKATLGGVQTRRLDALGMDGRWGPAADALRTFYKNRRSTYKELVFCLGFPVLPGQKPFEQYERRPGWLFEDMLNPLTAQTVRWVYQPSSDQTYQYLKVDADRAKSYMVERLAQPMGTPGALVLHQGTPVQHQMLARHLAESERPEESDVTGPGGRKKEIWKVTGTRQDNDYFDVLYNLCVLATFKGCRVQPAGNVGPIMRKPRRRLSDKFKQRYGD